MIEVLHYHRQARSSHRYCSVRMLVEVCGRWSSVHRNRLLPYHFPREGHRFPRVQKSWQRERSHDGEKSKDFALRNSMSRLWSLDLVVVNTIQTRIKLRVLTGVIGNIVTLSTLRMMPPSASGGIIVMWALVRKRPA